MDVQKLMLSGHTTHDAEKVNSKNGKDFVKFGVAVNRYLGKEKGNEVTFYECLEFSEKRAEKALETIKKGDRVLISGRPQVDPYLSKDGEAKAAMSVLIEGWELLK